MNARTMSEPIRGNQSVKSIDPAASCHRNWAPRLSSNIWKFLFFSLRKQTRKKNLFRDPWSEKANIYFHSSNCSFFFLANLSTFFKSGNNFFPFFFFVTEANKERFLSACRNGKFDAMTQKLSRKHFMPKRYECKFWLRFGGRIPSSCVHFQSAENWR